jgi:antitoxin component YwqK of YwqJK toxin-antitoxin module
MQKFLFNCLGLSFKVFLALALSLSIAGCNGGSSNSSGTTPGDETDISGVIELPESSPLQEDKLSIEVDDASYPVDSKQRVSLPTLGESPANAYLMLPQRESDEWPSVYMLSTLLPGEENTRIDSEGTAISLVMQAIPQELLLNAGSASEVKQSVRNNSLAFIDKFETMIEADPYTLHLHNLNNVYDEIYLGAVQSSLDALKALMPTQDIELAISRTSTNTNTNYRSTSYDGPSDMDLHVVYDDPAHTLLGLSVKPEKENNRIASYITLDNDTSLYVRPRIFDLVSGGEWYSADLPVGIISKAFDEHLLDPQQGFWGAYQSNEQSFEVEHRDVVVDFVTAGITGIEFDGYTESTTFALQLRTIYSKVLLPSINTVFSVKDVAIQPVFGVLYNSGLFDKAAPALYQWELLEALGIVLDEMTSGLNPTNPIAGSWPNPVINEILSLTANAALQVNSEQFAKMGLTLISLKATIAIWAADMLAVVNDARHIPSTVSATVNFPIDLLSMTPLAISRRDGGVIETEEVTLSGFGLKTLDHVDGRHIPEIVLSAKNREGELVDSAKFYPSNALNTNDPGTEIKFEVFGQWLNADSNVDTIEVSIDHIYTSRNLIGMNNVYEITVPPVSDQASFTIQVGAMVITSIDQERVQGNDELILSVSGMTTNIDDYTVYFRTHTGSIVHAAIHSLSQGSLALRLPSHENMEVGPISVYIENTEGIRSNEVALTFIPEKVEFISNGMNEFGQLELAMTQAQGLPDIRYVLNGSAPEYNYSAPISVSDGTTVTAYVIQRVYGQDYASEESEFTHSTCPIADIPQSNSPSCPSTYDIELGSSNTFNQAITMANESDPNSYTSCSYGHGANYYEDPGILDREQFYVNAQLHGLSRYWHENGQISSQGYYKEGNSHGLSEAWYDNGIRMSQNYTYNGEYCGAQTSWYESGQKESEDYYADGEKHGLSSDWYENGNKEFEAHFANGSYHGTLKRWNEDGTLLYCWNYVNGTRGDSCAP